MLVRDVMTTDVVTAGVDTTLPQLVRDMMTSGVSGLPVVDADRRVVGVVTEADLVAREAFGHQRRRLLNAVDDLLHRRPNRWWERAEGVVTGEIMSSPARTASPHDTVRAVAARMVTESIKRLPVVDDGGRLVGIVSQRDLLRLLHRSDEELRLAVEAALADPVKGPEDHHVTCAVADGIVTLSGTVHTTLDRDVVLAAVRDVPGVVDVREQILTGAPAT